MIHVQQLFIYPIKSISGITLQTAQVQQNGFQHDRVFMITEPDGTFITARQYHQLLRLKANILADGIQLSAPDQSHISIHYSDFSITLEATEVWGNHFESHIASIAINRWLSEYLQKDVQLRWVGSKLTRRVKRYPEVSLSFADGFPYLLLNRASFDYLQQRCPEPLDIRQMRGNIIISGALPFAEDGWKTIRIGNIIFDLVKPCSRCILTTVNIHSATASQQQEPLNTLRQFRSDDHGDIDFGMNMIARNTGIINIDDKIEILETQPAKQYQQKQSLQQISRESEEKTVIIEYQNTTFIGNNQLTILEQLEQQNISIPYSCRAGICGRCRIVLEDGEVTPLTQSAVQRNQRILACSCIPKGNIKIR